VGWDNNVHVPVHSQAQQPHHLSCCPAGTDADGGAVDEIMMMMMMMMMIPMIMIMIFMGVQAREKVGVQAGENRGVQASGRPLIISPWSLF